MIRLGGRCVHNVNIRHPMSYLDLGLVFCLLCFLNLNDVVEGFSVGGLPNLERCLMSCVDLVLVLFGGNPRLVL